MTDTGQESPLGDVVTKGQGGADTGGVPGPGGGLRLLAATSSRVTC